MIPEKIFMQVIAHSLLEGQSLLLNGLDGWMIVVVKFIFLPCLIRLMRITQKFIAKCLFYKFGKFHSEPCFSSLGF